MSDLNRSIMSLYSPTACFRVNSHLMELCTRRNARYPYPRSCHPRWAEAGCDIKQRPTKLVEPIYVALYCWLIRRPLRVEIALLQRCLEINVEGLVIWRVGLDDIGSDKFRLLTTQFERDLRNFPCLSCFLLCHPHSMRCESRQKPSP